MIKAVIFDFGGVLAEEGFSNGLRAIAEKEGLNPDDFYALGEKVMYQSGYVRGTSDEAGYWKTIREEAGVTASDKELRAEILRRFILRPEMMAYVDRIKSRGLMVDILSDQTNWLEEIDEKTPFYHHFDFVYNSFRIHKSKRDLSVFREISSAMGLRPEEVLFVDDNRDNVKRASEAGLRTIYFRNVEDFKSEIATHIKL